MIDLLYLFLIRGYKFVHDFGKSTQVINTLLSIGELLHVLDRPYKSKQHEMHLSVKHTNRGGEIVFANRSDHHQHKHILNMPTNIRETFVDTTTSANYHLALSPSWHTKPPIVFSGQSARAQESRQRIEWQNKSARGNPVPAPCHEKDLSRKTHAIQPINLAYMFRGDWIALLEGNELPPLLGEFSRGTCLRESNHVREDRLVAVGSDCDAAVAQQEIGVYE